MEQGFYTRQSLITNPSEFNERYDTLPDTPKQLLNIVQDLVIHGDLGKLYGATFSKKQTDEELLRTVPQMLEKLLLIDGSELIVARPPNLRLIGMCRDYALLLISFLRSKNIPARMRVGFANYFDSEIPYEDHWVVEYFSASDNRWVRVDAQVDEVQKEHFKIGFNTQDMPQDGNYLLGGAAWTQCRQGEREPDDFGYNKNWKGWHSVKGNLLHDFNCMIGLELLPWDLWTELATKNYSALNRLEKDILDEMAALTVNPEIKPDILLKMAKKLPNQYLDSIYSELKVLGISKSSPLLNPDSLEEPFSIHKKTGSLEAAIPANKNHDYLALKGGRQNNLKNIDVSIPKEKMTVITGVSGSGKSSLAFDTIYAEGKRRYLDNMSNAAKMQEQMEKPDFDLLQGLTPTIAIEQKKGSLNPRSTLGTLTGIMDYLRMLYVSVGIAYCPFCGIPLVKSSKNKNKCPQCGHLYQKLSLSLFNANSHGGACHHCNGLGILYDVNPDAIVMNEDISVLDGATYYWGKLRGKKPTGNWMVGELFAIAADRKVDLNLPWKELPKDFKQAVLYGTGDKIYSYHYNTNGRDTEMSRPAAGAIPYIRRMFREAITSENPYKRYMVENPCEVCHGELLCPEARYTLVKGYRFPQLTQMTVEQLYHWTHTLKTVLSKEETARVSDVLTEIEMRTTNLMQVGLAYLTISRTAPTLSGGELQRVRLSSQLGSDLIGLTYILDEPSIGLHPKDHHLMINTMRKLCDKGNTVIVVEHDKDTMLAADYIIDIGPGAGVHGGEIIAEGTVAQIRENPLSITGPYLQKGKPDKLPALPQPKEWLLLKGCNKNNLKNIDASFPLHSMCCVTGVSGSGKSTLVFDTLIPALESSVAGKHSTNTGYRMLEGHENIDGFIHMNQSPVGKSSRSVPATYIGAFDSIRALFASQPEAKQAGFGESHFSFNSKDGCCPVCDGLGQTKIVLQYMADHWVSCPECKGKRYKEPILDILVHGKNIAEVMSMDISEAAKFFKDEPELRNKLALLDDVGLSYLKLGQSTATLSGGESQRLKLAKELGSKKKKHMVYILDEPTTGLHFKDIDKLLVIFRKLVEENHTLIIIEHNMELAKASDWIIDIGPAGGSGGGEIVAAGTPRELSENPASLTGKYL